MNKKCYMIKGNKCFLLRFANTFFGSKWFGLWFPPYKFLDYFAFKFGCGEKAFWLTSSTQKGFKYSNFEARHFYELGGCEVEEVEYPTKGSGIVDEIEVKKSESGRLKVECELGIDVRKYYEDLPADVKIEEIEDGFRVRAPTKDFYILSDRKIELEEKYWKEHFPGEYVKDWLFFNERPERCLVLKFSTSLSYPEERKVRFLFSIDKCWERSDASQIEIEADDVHVDILRNSIYRCGEFKIEYNGDFGFIAGYPYFLDFWVRDEALNIQNFLYLGWFEEIKRALEKHLKYERKGVIPFLIRFNNKVLYHSIDTTPLWLISFFSYLKFSGDTQFLRRNEEVVRNCLEKFFKLDVDEDYLVETNGLYTWMDSIERRGKPIEVQAFWAKAFLEAFDFLQEKWLKRCAEKILEQMERFRSDDFYCDRLINSRKVGRSANPIFLTFYKLLDKERADEVLKVLESDEFTTPVGIRSFSTKDKEFNPNSYHKGMVWNLLTNLMVFSEFNYNRVNEGFKYFEILKENLGKRCLGCLDEVYDKDFKPQGALNQAWSISFIPRFFYEFILGLKPNAIEKVIVLEPKDQRRVCKLSTKFRVEDTKLNLKYFISGSGERVLRILDFPQGYKLLFIPNFPRFYVNGNLYKDKVVLEGKNFEIRF